MKVKRRTQEYTVTNKNDQKKNQLRRTIKRFKSTIKDPRTKNVKVQVNDERQKYCILTRNTKKLENVNKDKKDKKDIHETQKVKNLQNHHEKLARKEKVFKELEGLEKIFSTKLKETDDKKNQSLKSNQQ